MDPEMVTQLFRFGEKTFWIWEMISDAILVLRVQKHITLVMIPFGAEAQNLML